MPLEIGQLTPGELLAIITARMERGARERAELAWMTALMSRQKKLPPLEKLLRPTARSLKTSEQARAEFEELRERLGG